jgi:hypothetical protein
MILPVAAGFVASANIEVSSLSVSGIITADIITLIAP